MRLPPIKSIHWKAQITRGWWGGIIGATLAVVLGMGLRFVHFGEGVSVGQRWINRSYDLLFQFRPDIKTDGAVLVYIDEESHDTLKQSHEKAWDRSLHAQLLERLKAEQAKIVVMDIVFSEPGTEAANQALAAAMKAHGKVVLGVDETNAGNQGLASGPRLLSPIKELEAAAMATGLVTTIMDPDYGQRQYFSGDYQGADFVPSLSWKAAELAGASITGVPRARDQERWLQYYGPPGALPNISYYKALRTNGPAPGFFRDKTVFVGKAPTMTGFTGEAKDEFRSPYTWWTRKFSSGVEVHATGYLNLMRGDWLVRLSPVWEGVALCLLGGLLGFSLALVKPVSAVILATVAGFGIALASFVLFWKFRIWWGWLLVAALQLPVAVIWSVCYNSIRLYTEKKVLEASLCLHISPARVAQILKRPDLLRPGAEKQEISIMFTDIANFTNTTARMEPDDLFKLLNQYFETSLQCIHEEDGTVIKLIGDAIFAIWNAPFVQPHQQERACRAALKMRSQLFKFDKEHQTLPLRTRVGLHSGNAYVGNVGSTARFDYTAIGDSINLASRLEGLNKYLGTDILATREIQKIVEQSVISRLAGHFIMKGLNRVTEVHELIGLRAENGDSPPWSNVFSDALHQFQRRAFDAAESGFHRTLEMRPEDGPARFYLEKIQEFRKFPPATDWAGEIVIAEK